MTKEEILKDFDEDKGLKAIFELLETMQSFSASAIRNQGAKQAREYIKSLFSNALTQLEQETSQKFDTFKVTEYPNYSDFKDTRQAYLAGQMHIMIEIKQLIDKITKAK